MEGLIKLFEDNQTVLLVLVCLFAFVVLSITAIFLTAFFQRRRITFWPPSIEPVSSGGTITTATPVQLNEQYSSLVQRVEESIVILTKQISQLEQKVLETFKHTETLATKIDYVERLAILPNYEIPDIASLRTMEELPDDISGKNVLVKLDLDIAIAKSDGTPIDHFKFIRASKTIQHLIKMKARIILLIGQGLSNIDYLEESVICKDLTYHVSKLIEFLEIEPTVVFLDEVSQLNDYLSSEENYQILVLPNLLQISSEEALAQKAPNENKLNIDFSQSLVVKQLRPFYDIFVLDDFRSTIKRLPSNIGLSVGKQAVVGKGVQSDLGNLEKLIRTLMELGRRASNHRVCICGSSRPNDVLIVDALLQAKLFDKILLGPFPSLVVYAAQGNPLNKSIWQDLTVLAQANNHDIHALVENYGRHILDYYADKIVLPVDFLVDDGSLRSIKASELEAADISIQGIGNESVEKYKEEINSASLVFHFGMLGSAKPKYRSCTEEIIKTYSQASCISFMAGDHIAGIAKLISAESGIDYMITGAKTTSYYITGKHLPGIEPYIK